MKWLKKLRSTVNRVLYKQQERYKNKVSPPQAAPLDNSLHYEKILNTLKNERAALSVKFELAPEPFVSMMLDVDPNRQFIIIDELNTPLGHRLACAGEPFVLSAKENGIFIFFHSRVIDHGTIDGISFYRLAFPKHIEYLQRRLTTRLAVPTDIPLSANFLIPQYGVVRARICDISLAGMRLALPKNLKRLFENTTKINHCRILNPFLPAGEFSLDIKYCSYDLNAQRTLIGCQFSNIDNVGLKYLSTLAKHLQHPPILTP